MAVGTEVHFANQNIKGLQNKTTNKSVYSNKDSNRQIAIKVDIGNQRYTNTQYCIVLQCNNDNTKGLWHFFGYKIIQRGEYIQKMYW